MTPDKGSRCPECFWALYDGRYCQNKDCRRFGKRVKAPIYLTNEEAIKMINENPKGEHATSTIVLRVTPIRKAAYVRAAHPQTLAAWMFEQCDRASEFDRLPGETAYEYLARKMPEGFKPANG